MTTNTDIRVHVIASAAALLGILLIAGCGDAQQPKDKGFYTSGSRDADQRAEQRVSRDEQLRGQGQGDQEKKSLYDRLGGEQGLSAIVDDFVPRVLADPRVNWERKGVTQGGFSLSRNKPVEWQATPGNVAELKKHMVQFLSVATGGPPRYDGREMGEAHKNLHITNAEFDASIGDLKASLDKLGVPTHEQKELLAIVESTRPQIVEKR
jgi:hemoglobin